jgi:cytochrome c-type biogenesis protein CcmH/NrfG
MQKSRREMLEEFVTANPQDAFARYGLAIECGRTGATDAARTHFDKLLELHPDYVPGYFQYGQMLASIPDNAAARAVLTRGIEAARRKGDAHAADEMQAFLEELG